MTAPGTAAPGAPDPGLLDRPPHSALSTRHAALAERAGGALRYLPGTIPFAAAGDGDPADLARLIRPGEVAAFAEARPTPVPAGFEQVFAAPVLQMLAGETAPPEAGGPPILALGPGDAAEMLALAEAARPGPFSLRAIEVGRFWGVRIDGRLAAMAGERMSMPGFVEISGVCVDEGARGLGLGRRMTAHAAAEIAARGDRPFLHVLATNAPAVGLYRAMGFEIRTEIAFNVLRRV